MLPLFQAETVAMHIALGWKIIRTNHFAGTVIIENRNNDVKTIDQYGQIL